ncbi:protein-glucosylgalactosylhydroxylysine glucosidase [Daphnia magna]|uniref:protein-glucosylgalactosylhydroxylysine glucosidase n=1 Tax=Daphnia magna TaxID=35525 RepID=UPI001E1BB099|nr:protein-glucosylgalactosylhydroxylysine glucosidase [Daphnia magna]
MFLPIALLLFGAIVSGNQSMATESRAVDLSLDSRIFESNSLPIDELEMPSIGNGQLATGVYTDTVYMNGLYNGELGESHRARIPSQINIRMSVGANQTVTDQRFILDTEKGMFIERAVVDGAIVEQRTFAHRLITSLLVTQITVDFSQSVSDSLTLSLSDNPGPVSEDITFTPLQNYTQGLAGKEQTGQTKVVEDSQYQNGLSNVTVIYSEVPEKVTLTRDRPTITFVMSIASTYAEASSTYSYAYNLTQSNDGHLELVRTHVDQWKKIWDSGNILMEGPNLELAKVVCGSMYYLLSSLPHEPVDANRRRFSGLSPGSLANGAFLKDYQGHSFWDTETWMFPSVLMLWPYVAKDLLLYRMSNIHAARDRAVGTGYQGARFPWESGFTGVEVTPDCCPETRDNQQHITGDISFATRQYWAATGDTKWLNGENYSFPLEINGCNFIREMAQFWASRAEYNSATDQYEIKGVMPPDEDHPYVDNSVYTNVIASYSIFFAKHAECQCGSSMTGDVPETWLDIARKIKIPFDVERNYHPEFDGYQPGETIKQADVVLLGFPLMYVTDPVVRQNDLDIYENVTRVDGPAMTWSMHAIGHLESGDEARGAAMLNRSFQPYLIEPFKVWNEAQNHKGAFNFITGMGGFLQSILFGYAGLRLTVEKLTANPILPPGITNFTLQGMDYLGCSFNINIQTSTVDINWISGSSCDSLDVVPDQVKEMEFKSYSAGRMTFPRGPFTIKRKTPSNCPLPDANNNLNSAAPSSNLNLNFLLTTFVASKALLTNLVSWE